MQRFPQASFVGTIVVWASAFSVIKALIDHGVGAEQIALSRYLVAAPGFAFLLWRAGGLPGLNRRDATRLLVAGVVIVAGYHLSLNIGAESTASGVAALIVALSPALTMAFAIAFGIGFGELFGDLGRHWFGLAPLVLDREKALLPFLGLAVAIGFVHVVLGMVLGVVNAWRGHPRLAVGRGAALAMVLFVAIALLAGLKVLPHSFFTPAVIVLLLAFPVMVIAEGIIAPIEFLSTLSNVLSYARIMALGTASVMMAVVANRMTGMLGSVVVGALFGLIFHVVNFALGLFSPTIHALRLHYVEFFGKFYSPGGTRYRPFGHGSPGTGSIT